jgi:hypothetical protein
VPLVWTRGERMPLELLRERLRCPKCGRTNVLVFFEVAASRACGLSERQNDGAAISACDTVSVAHGAFDAGIKNYPNHRWTLLNGMMLIREYEPST